MQGRSLRVRVAVLGLGIPFVSPAAQQPKALRALPTPLSPVAATVLAASNGFSFALFHQISGEQAGKNVFVSPLSASFALAMAMNGAAGQTFEEMRSGLQLGAATLPAIDSGYKSAVHVLQGSWREAFDPKQTIDAPFHAAGGDQPARLMTRQGSVRYAETPTYQAVELTYGNAAFSLVALLPKPETSVEAVAASLDAKSWSSLAADLHEDIVKVFFPKLKMSWEGELGSDLRQLGMRSPFDPKAADFTRLSSAGEPLFISRVLQKTFVDINEQGTEAAAVTATMMASSFPPPPPVIRIDRPFVFVIRERLTGTVLFMGKVVRLP